VLRKSVGPESVRIKGIWPLRGTVRGGGGWKVATKLKRLVESRYLTSVQQGMFITSETCLSRQKVIDLKRQEDCWRLFIRMGCLSQEKVECFEWWRLTFRRVWEGNWVERRKWNQLMTWLPVTSLLLSLVSVHTIWDRRAFVFFFLYKTFCSFFSSTILS